MSMNKDNLNIIDLTFPFENGMPAYPSENHQKFESAQIASIDLQGRETRRFVCGSHCGTHVDAPKHFIGGTASIDEIPLNRLIGEAQVIDFGLLPPKSIIYRNDISHKINENSPKKIILKTGWSRFWKTDQYFKDWPFLSADAAEFLIEKRIELLAMDFPSPDPVYFGTDKEKDCPNHKLFFKSGVILVEYLCNLDKLSGDRIFLVVMPLKLSGFDGSPARVIAWNLQ